MDRQVRARYPVSGEALTDEDRLILKILRLYYERGLTQAQVAGRMGFSRPKVSKLMSEGMSRGLVKIEIAEPSGDFAALEISLEDRYDLREAVVVPSAEDRRVAEAAAGSACAALLSRLCTSETVLGLSWGVSVRALADATTRRAFTCKRVVPLLGGMGKAKPRLHSNQVCADLAAKLGAEYLQLAAPAVAASIETREELASMPGIAETLVEGAAADVAVAGIGGILPNSTLVEAGYFSLEEFLSFADRGVVGDVCCHFLDGSGAPRCPELSARILGITPEGLRAIPITIGIATGRDKAAGTAAVLRGGLMKSLVCDESLARALLEVPPVSEIRRL
ncbi:sugar-binding transcriptional regulator [Rubrobacter radiotolerans]|uniref:Sugar-binding domain-containing protein n=1 Tax=Rubrobacter radiotolerans TaxID=42256 RepID=A0AB35T378_RUBRA|nr:sugar-binding domain-containing protein [Rubrobacter radiotolerans]MDX5894334.1 sugar-binding domain-containing protein [Rubrobacter radiotolerans]SMC05760.1 DNA-binding transcriptional regulator LsrR, DeoR family [Rubrobacter radiotolerans DSM 5868]